MSAPEPRDTLADPSLLAPDAAAAALATVVGVLVEVPVMLSLVAIVNRTQHWFVPADVEGRRV